ncbi:protein SOB FIVE-LIKE 5-like [Gastrolobium bilobum]|uniref:protein SOB FIVE-LIKE 5-like n=1 Tax=Gastrolobium bilobum TaxID=150636 RepID=UPI002AB2140A|nr:protein SOB FIVE-LIKE 5-like [Gastrolobium bilobum]
MDISASQYSNASESGWTHYLDQSSLSENYFQRKGGIVDYEGKEARMEEPEEDLSMVSDASSGPPHYDNEYYCENWYPCLPSTPQYTKESQKKEKVKEYGRCKQASPLDDTASSPLFSCPKEKSFSGNGAVENALDFSQCVSATRIKRKTKFQKHFSFFERSLGGKLASEEPGDPIVVSMKKKGNERFCGGYGN